MSTFLPLEYQELRVSIPRVSLIVAEYSKPNENVLKILSLSSFYESSMYCDMNRICLNHPEYLPVDTAVSELEQLKITANVCYHLFLYTKTSRSNQLAIISKLRGYNPATIVWWCAEYIYSGTAQLFSYIYKYNKVLGQVLITTNQVYYLYGPVVICFASTKKTEMVGTFIDIMKQNRCRVNLKGMLIELSKVSDDFVLLSNKRLDMDKTYVGFG